MAIIVGGAAVRVPGPLGPTRTARFLGLLKSPRKQKWYARLARGRSSLAPAFGGPPVLFAHSASPLAPGPLPLRGAAPARRARRRFAAPVRRLAPALASLGCRGRPPGQPPGSLARPACGLAPSLALAGPAALGAALRSAAGFRWSPLLTACGPLRFAWPRRGPPGPSPSGLRGRSAPAPGPVRPFGPLFPALAPGPFCARPACRAALSVVLGAFRLSVCSGGGGFSPASPPPLPPPPGARGERVAVPLGAPAPGPLGLPRGPPRRAPLRAGPWRVPPRHGRNLTKPPIVVEPSRGVTIAPGFLTAQVQTSASRSLHPPRITAGQGSTISGRDSARNGCCDTRP